MKIKVNKLETHNGLTVIQFATLNQNPFSFITLVKALEEDYIRIYEINKQGFVSNFKIINDSNYFVLIMENDLLKGLNNNRINNSCLLVAPHSKIILPLACIEQGRNFNAPLHTVPISNICTDEHFNIRYSENTNKIDFKKDFIKTKINLKNSVRDKNQKNIFTKSYRDFENFISNFVMDMNSNGMAVFFEENIIQIKIFSCSTILQDQFFNIIMDEAFSAYLASSAKEIGGQILSNSLSDFLSQKEVITINEKKCVGVGNQVWFKKNNLIGTELVYNSHLIYLSTFEYKHHLYSNN